MAKQTIKRTTTKKTYRKSKGKATKDKKGRLHCSNCGSYLSR